MILRIQTYVQHLNNPSFQQEQFFLKYKEMNKLLIISAIVLILLVILYTIFVNIIERDPKDIRLVYDITTNLGEGKRIIDSDTAVSYTHLTLPTKRIV